MLKTVRREEFVRKIDHNKLGFAMEIQQAEAVAREAIDNYFNEVDQPLGEVDSYSCNQCELDSYLCPHLYERLKKHIVNALTKENHAAIP
jgi:hypothetical protein